MSRTGSRAGWLGVPAVALAAALVYLTGGFEWADRHLLDLRFSLVSRPASGQVVVVSIDPESLAALDVWPWPRGYHATVLDNLLAAGARRVAFDVDFSSRSLEEEDRVFAESLQSAGARALLPVFQQWEGAGSGDGFVQTKPLAIFSPPAGLATINIQPESDGLVRAYGANTAPGSPLPLAIALAGTTGIPVDGFEIDYGIEVSGIPRLSYVQALTGAFEASRVAGRDVIVGATALELGDQSSVPVHAVLSGPLLQALAYESIVGGRTLVRFSPVWLCGLILLLSLAAGWPVQTLSWRSGLVLSLAVMGTLFALAAVVQRWYPIIVEIAAPCAAMAGWYGLALTRRIDHQELRIWMAALTSRRTELKMRHVVENSGEAIVTLDETGRIQTFNRAAERLFGRAAESVLGILFTQLAARAQLHWSTGHSRQQFEIDRLDGEHRIIEMVLSDPGLDGRPVRVAFLRDITESCAQRVALEHQATHDVLTDLPNRALLSRCLDEALTAGEGGERRTAALLMLDLDRFKEVNDTLGHTVGDLLLREIAGRLNESVGEGITIARLGGDEFAILVPAAGPVEAEREARQLIESLSRPFMVQGMLLQIDGSVGIALHPRDGGDAGVLLQRADVAMYQAKRQRNTFRFYDAGADECSLRSLTLKGEMREAIDRDLFQLHYQPKVRLSTGEASGVEGLLRWCHARHGWLKPLEFIPLAESTGLIGPLTHWVLREAVAQSARWNALGLTLRVSVNCSARNLLERDLPATVERLLRGANVDPSLLVLEITETAVIEEPERSLQVLRDIAALGVGLSIDDFGSAYASLDYLRKLPAAELKIDGSFIRSLDTDEACAAIVKATIGLAHDFGLKAVAEGIETPEVLDMLREMGCDEAQGYYIAHPMPAAAIPDWVAARACAPVPVRMERAGHLAGAMHTEPV